MARLNEDFQLTFHEVDTNIVIGFEEDEASLHVTDIQEVVPIPIQFEESTSRIPVNIADSEQLPAIFGEAIIIDHGGGPGDDYYTKEQTNALLDTKVDKIEGKGLSTNDLTDELVEEIHAGGGHQEVRLYNPSGTLTESQADILKQSPSNYINYLGTLFKLRYKSTSMYKYFSQITDVNNMPVIEINWTTNTWQYTMVVNEVLTNHINDNERHVNTDERTFWNNKLNCIDDITEERLIFTRN